MTMIVTALLIAALQATPSVEVQVSESENYLEFYNETIRQGLAQIQDEETLRYIGDAADRYDTDLYFRQRINAFLCGCEAEDLVYWLDGDGALYTDAIRKYVYLDIIDNHVDVDGFLFPSDYSLPRHHLGAGLKNEPSENEEEADLLEQVSTLPPQEYATSKNFCSYTINSGESISSHYWGDPFEQDVSIAWARCYGEVLFSMLGYGNAKDMLASEEAIAYSQPRQSGETILACKDNMIAYIENDYTLCPMYIRGITYNEQPPKAFVDGFMGRLLAMKDQYTLLCVERPGESKWLEADARLFPDLP